MNLSLLRTIPSVDAILQVVGDFDFPRPIVLAVVRRELKIIRTEEITLNFDGVLSHIRAALRALRASRVQPIINGTGILIHTNFGRVPLGANVLERVSIIGSNYNNLEFDLTTGSRGSRGAYLEQSLATLCGAEGAMVVNNNAAALVLILRHFCSSVTPNRGLPSQGRTRRGASPKNEVIISRGEMLQIGGGFRIPEILESNGARLREIGTTNKTSLHDYERAIRRETAMILKVHHSNFYMDGFVESTPTDRIAELAGQKRIPFVEDLGSGAVIEAQLIDGLGHEPTPAEVIRRGADLVCFSGDKLLGGPQAGIIAGRMKPIAALKREPLFRALRCDKLILSALEATVDLYLRARRGGVSETGFASRKRIESESTVDHARIPILDMLHMSLEELRLRAKNIISALDELPITATIGVGRAQVGGGTLPRSSLESVTLDLIHSKWKLQDVAIRLREHSVPIIGYIAHGRFKIDLRTVFPRQDGDLIRAINTLYG